MQLHFVSVTSADLFKSCHLFRDSVTSLRFTRFEFQIGLTCISIDDVILSILPITIPVIYVKCTGEGYCLHVNIIAMLQMSMMTLTEHSYVDSESGNVSYIVILIVNGNVTYSLPPTVHFFRDWTMLDH